MYKSLPLNVRDKVNFLRHRINSNVVLLMLLSPLRHKLTIRHLASFNEPFRLRLGESRKFEGWVSTNYQVFCRHLLDATKPFKIGAGASYIVIDNVIEHLSLTEGTKMLRNIFECLIPGGVVRIATPNLREIVKMYFSPNPDEIANFRNDFHPHGVDVVYPADLLKATFNHFGHQTGYIYDLETLNTKLTEIGFVGIKQYKPGESEIHALKGVESRVGLSDRWGQLCIEASKPLP